MPDTQTPAASSADPTVAVTPMDLPIHLMRVAHGQMHPPEVGGAGGLGGRVGSAVKRAVRKATSWYVEPRWILQQELDGQAIEFSALAYNSVYRIDNELDELRRQLTRLKMQLAASLERTNRVRRDLTGLVDDLARQSEMLEQTALRSDVRPLAKEITSILDRLGAVGTTGADIDYVGFEDRFRGITDELRASQERYVGLFPPARCRGGSSTSVAAGARCCPFSPRPVTKCSVSTPTRAWSRPATPEGSPAVVDDGIHFLSQRGRRLAEGDLLRPGGRTPHHAGAGAADRPVPARSSDKVGCWSSRRSTRGARLRSGTTSTPTRHMCVPSTPRRCGTSANRWASHG